MKEERKRLIARNIEKEREKYRAMFKSVYLLLPHAEQRKVYTAQEFKELSSE